MSIKTKCTVLIVGAGPVGLLTALRLGQAGISTLVIESHTSLLPTTRAMVYMPVVVPVLRSLGIMDVVAKNAFLNHDGVTWRNIEGEVLANLPLSSDQPGEFGGVLLIGQHKMNCLILAELAKYPSVEIRFGLKCVGIEQTPSSSTVRIMAHTSDSTDSDIFLEASYVLATDGANSTVRRALCIPFEGFTYQNFKMIGCDVLLDFHHELNFTPLNFIVHPTDWCVIAYTGQEEDDRPSGSGYRPQWRIAYVEDPSLPDSKDQIVARAHQRMPAWTKGKSYELTRAEPYRLHQRCAATASKGRVCLAGDALHSNNPIGGLGLTGGILDAFCYGNAFVRVVKEGEDAGLLAECGDARRRAWIETTDGLSRTNMERLYRVDEETVKAREGFFGRLKNDLGFARVVRRGFDGMMKDSFERKDEKRQKEEDDVPEKITDGIANMDVSVKS